MASIFTKIVNGEIPCYKIDETDEFLAFLDDPVLDAEDGFNAAVGIEDGVKNEGLQRGVLLAFWRGNAVHNSVQKHLNTVASFGTDAQNIFQLTPNEVDDLVRNLIRIGAGEVQFVQHRNDLQVVLNGQVKVADGLGLDSLGSVHHQQGAFAGRNASGNFVGKVHVAGGVDQVQAEVVFAADVIHLDGVALDGDAALALQIHVVEELVHLLSRRNALGYVEKAVGQGALTVVDMGDDAEVPDVVHGGCKGNLRRCLLFFGTSDICAWPHRNAQHWAADSPRY